MPGGEENLLGGHAVAAVGYLEAERMFVIRNSWGGEWGDGGYFKMPYEEIYQWYNNLLFTFNLPYGTTDVWDFTPDKVRYGHPTQKPQDICQRIIKASSNENDNVLIPFAGSGSEIVACEELKRNWTAFEIEDSYIEIINKRLDELKTKLF
jgi:DNA modification methylase